MFGIEVHILKQLNKAILLIHSFFLVQWIIESKSVVFGEDVHLKCNGNACEPKTIKKWIGGPGYNVLCFDDYSADNSKYEMMVNSTTGYFILIIHNLTGNDINFRYTCACGFHQFTKVLDVADTFICKFEQIS